MAVTRITAPADRGSIGEICVRGGFLKRESV
jgi:hypothetical protein